MIYRHPDGDLRKSFGEDEYWNKNIWGMIWDNSSLNRRVSIRGRNYYELSDDIVSKLKWYIENIYEEKEDVGIGNVKYGELLFYYPIKFETSLSFEDLCEKIAESSVFFSDAYQERVLNAMGHSLANMVE